MCAVNAQYRIVGWNRGAEQLFGRTVQQALGQPCYEVIAGADGQGSPVCGRNCLPMQLAKRGLAAGALEMERGATDGPPQFLTCSTLVTGSDGGGDAALLFHIFRVNEDRQRWRSLLAELQRIVEPRSLEPFPRQGSGQPAARLTGRELEVLRLLREGLSTAEMASRLFVSPLTIRNHIQNIRQKLQVRNRLQAVASAERRGLL